jgi:hypothetical protein
MKSQSFDFMAQMPKLSPAAPAGLRQFCRTYLPVILLVGLTSGAPASAQQPEAAPAPTPPAIEPKAVDVLKAAAETLASAKTMSFTAVNTYERAALNGQPLFYATLSQVTLQRPDKLRVIARGDGVPDEFYYDGKTMTAYVPSLDVAAVAEAPATIDEMFDAAWEKAAIYFPFDDVMLSNPYTVFAKQMISAFYVGQSKVVGGTTTDMVAVAGEDMQAEIWIGAADHLPRLVRVVYPHEPAHALYQTEYSDWRLGDTVAPDAFRSEKAARAKPIRFAPPGPGEPPKPGEPPPQH